MQLEITSRFNALLMDGYKQIEIILINVYLRNCDPISMHEKSRYFSVFLPFFRSVIIDVRVSFK